MPRLEQASTLECLIFLFFFCFFLQVRVPPNIFFLLPLVRVFLRDFLQVASTEVKTVVLNLKPAVKNIFLKMRKRNKIFFILLASGGFVVSTRFQYIS